MSPSAADSPPSAKATAPAATPMLPARNVQALMMPDPAPARTGGRVARARRGAAAYGNARPAPMPNNPTTSGAHIRPAAPIAITTLATAIKSMPLARAPRGPKRRMSNGAENAKISSPQLIGNSDRPAPTGVSARPVGLCASRL
jgi:hypothetical protein